MASQRGREGGYRLRRPPAEILLGEVVRSVDGPLAPFGDAVELAYRVKTEPRHAGLFDLFLDVRNAAAAILDHTSLAGPGGAQPQAAGGTQAGGAAAALAPASQLIMSIKHSRYGTDHVIEETSE